MSKQEAKMNVFTLSTVRLVFLGALLAVVAGCASDGSFQNPFANNEPAPTTSYFFSEFSDIPIPNEMSENRSNTFITFAPSGVKCGVQLFSGRVEVVSLMNTMRRHMASNGWTLRSLLRAQESVMTFEKPDRIASLQLSDGLIKTEMRVFVSSRLEGDSPAVEINPYTPPATGGEQKLSQ